MKRKTFWLCSLLMVVFAGIVATISSRADEDPEEPISTAMWEQDPPEVDSIWVQKLTAPISEGRNMIMRIKYASSRVLPDTIRVYYGASGSVLFNDNGVAPDLVAGDHIYASYLTENLGSFEMQMTALNANLQPLGTVTVFEGHNGKSVPVQLFDIVGFNNFQEVLIPAKITSGFNCDAELKREFSLFITKLAVTEDPARTYNVVDSTGNPVGAWTFGQMIKNMANEAATGVSAKSFLKAWVTSWLDDIVVNGDTVDKRVDARLFLIYPWVIKANPAFVASSPLFTRHDVTGAANYLIANPAYWETLWNNTPEYDLLINAPFKLSAIVNRIDLRGNPAYQPAMHRAGETRFIFSLIAPVTGEFTTLDLQSPSFQHGGHLTAGTVPEPLGQGKELLAADWNGMNVIFEYMNPQATECAIQDFAMAWANLSTYAAVGNSGYNAALQAITDQVTAAGAIPSLPNGSAIGRIRTNERLFFPSGVSQYNKNENKAATDSWDNSTWELRQYEINAQTHLIEQAPVSNTPVSAANYVTPDISNSSFLNNQSILTNSSRSFNLGTDSNALIADPVRCDALLDWAFHPGNDRRILNERHSMPKMFPGTSTPLLAGSAVLHMDYVHFLNFNWKANTYWRPYSAGTYTSAGNYLRDREIRQKLSINTCQGCHAGETKTVFTHVRPLGYGEEADYMGTTPGYHYNFGSTKLRLDTRFASNDGTSAVRNGASIQTDPNYSKSKADENRYFQKVSAFITGRSYTGKQGFPTFDDDDPMDVDDDKAMSEFNKFVVNDPANMTQFNAAGLPPRAKIIDPALGLEWDQQHGFNELLRRMKDMCTLLNVKCDNTSVTMRVFTIVTYAPNIE